MKLYMTIILGALLIAAGCTTTGQAVGEDNEKTVYTIGWVGPLTGDAAVYGIPTQGITKLAVKHINEQWADQNKELRYIYEDGRCTPKDALSAAQSLVQTRGVSIINGGLCSGETLGIAPYANENNVLLFSALSSSPEIKDAGDYVFRNYPSDDAQAAAMAPFMASQGVKSVAIISENTDYAQALRKEYLALLPELGIDVLADEVVATISRDVRTEIQKMKASGAETVLFIPQTVPMGILMAEQMVEADMPKPWYGADVVAFPATYEEHPEAFDQVYVATLVFEKENDPAFLAALEESGCDIGVYCATSYDAVYLIAALLEQCGEDADCFKREMYALENWEGPFAGPLAFDEHGEVAGNFKISQAQKGELVDI